MLSLKTNIVVGSRVVDVDGNEATARYIGSVAISKDSTDWIGVEWDRPGRGKHNGTVVDKSGVSHTYFSCAEGMGSFVKPNKLQLAVDSSKRDSAGENV
jgi:dynactin complex subunit